MDFSVDFKALVLALLGSVAFFFLQRWRNGFAEPSLAIFDVKCVQNGSRRSKWMRLPVEFMRLALLFFVLAFIDPHLLLDKALENDNAGRRANPPTVPTEGIAIYLVMDQSGSMKDKVLSQTKAGLQMISKIDLVKEVTKQFIMGDPQLGLYGRPSDLTGLIYFARAARVMSPLTLDHEAVLEELAKFNVIGDMDQDGTSIGYAIYKAANLMAATRHYAEELIGRGEPAYTIKSNVIILLTDGLQDPNPLDKGKRYRNMDVPEAAVHAKEMGVRLYMVNVDPQLSTDEFAPYRHIMQRAAELTGGHFYMVDNASSLQNIYNDIDKLEKSTLPPPQNIFQKDKRPDLYRRISFFPFLIGLGLLCFLASIIFETCLLRRVP